MLARMLMFEMQVDDDLLYRGIENQLTPAYSSLYLSNFLFFHTLKNEIFRQRFRMRIFGMQVDGDLLYRGMQNQPSPAYSSLYLSNYVSY